MRAGAGHFDQNPTEIEELENAIREASQFLLAWQDVALHGMEGEGGDGPPGAVLQRAYDEYRRSDNEWAVLRDGGLDSTFCTALAKMPTISWLDIGEGTRSGGISSETRDTILPTNAATSTGDRALSEPVVSPKCLAYVPPRYQSPLRLQRIPWDSHVVHRERRLGGAGCDAPKIYWRAEGVQDNFP